MIRVLKGEAEREKRRALIKDSVPSFLTQFQACRQKRHLRRVFIE